MIDFKKLREHKAKSNPIHPRKIFNALPKPLGINDLYASQAEVLDTWFSRRKDKDIVVKLHTGGGKTLAAMLIAQSVMNECNEPVLYLAPTNQLVEQVLNQSHEYGVSALPYTKGKPLSNKFLNGESVLVGSYQTLFNGYSKFGISGSNRQVIKAGAIILDDAHVALSSVRQAFSLTISTQDNKEAYSYLVECFRAAFEEVEQSGAFDEITRGKDYGVVEVPSWAWLQKIVEVQQYFSSQIDESNQFVWPFLRDNLAICHCLFSRTNVTITPIFPLVDLLPTFQKCPRRIYMSATIADDSEIVRTFGTSLEAVEKPITSTSLTGVGERMILVPAMMDLGETEIKPMIENTVTKLASEKRGVVILTPSGQNARDWISVAEYPDSANAVSDRVGAMRAETDEFCGPLVLANRYDGIDLPGNSCRCLIIDGLPQGTTNYDIFRMNVLADSAVSSLLAQRIEQGMGRGTRGGSDYCVVILLGTKLVGWIGQKKNLAHLTKSTHVQLKMGKKISGEIKNTEELDETILKCLERDSEWVHYHASELVEAAYGAPDNTVALRIAERERRAFGLQRLGQFSKALQTLQNLINHEDLQDDVQLQAWLSASAAKIAYQMGNMEQGQKLQTQAFAINNNHSPPKMSPRYAPQSMPGQQAQTIVNKLLDYEDHFSLIASFDEAVYHLLSTDASPNQYEEALYKLGLYLGFVAERPDKALSLGPDVLWRTDSAFDFVIEVKNDKNDDSPLYKNEHAQILEAENWFKENYPDRESVRVLVLPEAVAHEQATTAGTYALRLNMVKNLVGTLRSVLYELIHSEDNDYTLCQQCDAHLQRKNLKPQAIKKEFMETIVRMEQIDNST